MDNWKLSSMGSRKLNWNKRSYQSTKRKFLSTNGKNFINQRKEFLSTNGNVNL